MKWQFKCFTIGMRLFLASVVVCAAAASACAETPLQELIGRANDQVARFVVQEKFKADGKVELKEESTYDYLVILTNSGGEVSLDESRLAVKEEKKEQKKGVSMLVSNGFATLFLVFHPYYSSGFQFTDLGEDKLDGHTFRKVQFKHLAGMRSPAALALRGREYPLDLAGVAWIDPETGVIGKIDAGLGSSMEDIGLKSMRSEVQFQPIPFKGVKDVYWFPAQASVEVET